MSQQSDVKIRVMDHDSRYESEGKGNSPDQWSVRKYREKKGKMEVKA